jgi:hypothetical protein
MIDLTAVGIGMLAGMLIGSFIFILIDFSNCATLTDRIDELTHENANLKRRQPARDSHGRYIKDSKDTGA